MHPTGARAPVGMRDTKSNLPAEETTNVRCQRVDPRHGRVRVALRNTEVPPCASSCEHVLREASPDVSK